MVRLKADTTGNRAKVRLKADTTGNRAKVRLKADITGNRAKVRLKADPTTREDLETRERLLESAAGLFAANGFAKVTVRDICHAARANVAAVNYHFGGKTGLYEQVLRLAIAVMQETTTEAVQAGEGRQPREQLTAYIAVFLRRVFEGRDSWIHQMMMRELADPTPALDLVVDEVIRPRIAYLSKVIAALLQKPPADERVGRCVASVNAQCLAVLRNEVSERLGILKITAGTIDDMAHHIARFSLAGIRAIASE